MSDISKLPIEEEVKQYFDNKYKEFYARIINPYRIQFYLNGYIIINTHAESVSSINLNNEKITSEDISYIRDVNILNNVLKNTGNNYTIVSGCGLMSSKILVYSNEEKYKSKVDCELSQFNPKGSNQFN